MRPLARLVVEMRKGRKCVSEQVLSFMDGYGLCAVFRSSGHLTLQLHFVNENCTPDMGAPGHSLVGSAPQ